MRVSPATLSPSLSTLAFRLSLTLVGQLRMGVRQLRVDHFGEGAQREEPPIVIRGTIDFWLAFSEEHHPQVLTIAPDHHRAVPVAK
ncbi:hypothetical protein MB901379_01375 [Mycobacterium basiliense]|uniref:Uncharacterized protein n=1 Tax=Mycobacterium basiliense TaxID=2094119 RepID=A0A447GBJ7_9MYCO|nr:hypothetical protein MB901379_01375 [Mycobacterium basiliense]